MREEIDKSVEAALAKHLSTEPGSQLATLIQDAVEACRGAGADRYFDDEGERDEPTRPAAKSKSAHPFLDALGY